MASLGVLRRRPQTRPKLLVPTRQHKPHVKYLPAMRRSTYDTSFRQMRCTRSTAQERPLLPHSMRSWVHVACTSAAIALSVVRDCSRSASVNPLGKPSSSTPARMDIHCHVTLLIYARDIASVHGVRPCSNAQCVDAHGCSLLPCATVLRKDPASTEEAQ